MVQSFSHHFGKDSYHYWIWLLMTIWPITRFRSEFCTLHIIIRCLISMSSFITFSENLGHTFCLAILQYVSLQIVASLWSMGVCSWSLKCDFNKSLNGILPFMVCLSMYGIDREYCVSSTWRLAKRVIPFAACANHHCHPVPQPIEAFYWSDDCSLANQ